MSKSLKSGFDQYGAERFEVQAFDATGLERVKASQLLAESLKSELL